MPRFNSKDAKSLKEYQIDTYTKGFVSVSVVDGNTIQEYFAFKDIAQIIHHPNVGVEIVRLNNNRKVFYNDTPGEALILFDGLNSPMLSWMNSNLN